MEKLQKLIKAQYINSDVSPPKSGTSSNKAIQEGKKQLLGEKLSSSPEIFLFSSIDRRERQKYEGGLIGKCCCAIFSSGFFCSLYKRVYSILTWSRPASACRKCSVLYESASWKLKAIVIWARREGWRTPQSCVVTGERGMGKERPCAGCSDHRC